MGSSQTRSGCRPALVFLSVEGAVVFHTEARVLGNVPMSVMDVCSRGELVERVRRVGVPPDKGC